MKRNSLSLSLFCLLLTACIVEPEPERASAAWQWWDQPDQDGVPAVTDNCPDDFNPRAFNPDDPNNLERQPNCNWDSEVESGLWDFDIENPGPSFPPGDACDPNPRRGRCTP